MTSTTASTLAAASDLSASITNLNITQGMTKATSLTTTSDTEYPTSKAVNDRILTVTNALGGFVAIADKDNFPTAHPDPSGNAGTVVSISDAAGISVNSSGVGSLATRAGGSDAVIINGFPSALRGGATVGSATNANPYVLPSSVGLQVQTTTTAHTYDYHKYFINEEDANKLSGDIQDFQERYRVAASAPTASKDDGDLWFDTTNNKMMVYDATASAWSDVATPGNFSINTISSYSGTGGNSATFNGTAYRFVLSTPPTQSAAQMVVSINGVIQKPNAGTSQPSEGFAIDGNSIIFSNAPASGSDYFIITLGNSVDIGTPSDNVITTAMLQNSAVTTAKITNDAVDGTKIADDAIDSEHYTDGSIDTAHIAADQITGALIADDAVGAEHIEVLDANLQLADSSKIQIGTGNDLEIYHSGDVSRIRNTNDSGTLKIQAASNGENAINIVPNGTVELYYDGTKKFYTGNAGVAFVGNLYGNDNEKIILGSDGDLELYHNGTHGYITNTTGDLRITDTSAMILASNSLRLKNGASDETYISADANGAVELYYDNVKKFETTDVGVQATGHIFSTTKFRGNDDVKVSLGTSEDLQLYHNETDSYITNDTGKLRIYGSGSDSILIRAKDDEEGIVIKPNAEISLHHNNVKVLETHANGIFVKGPEGGDASVYFYADEGDDNDDKFRIVSTTSGELHFETKASGSWEDLMHFNSSRAVELYYDHNLKFETGADGAQVTGFLHAHGLRSDSDFTTFDRHVLQSNNGNVPALTVEHSNNTDPNGLLIFFSDGDPDNSSDYFIYCQDSSASRFKVFSNGDYWSSDGGSVNSDQTLKENIVDATPKLEDLKKIKVRNFNFKADYHPEKSKQKQIGFIAQEVEEVFPSLVSEYDIASAKSEDDDHVPVMKKGIKQAWAPILVKALQEAVAKIETLETKVAALEAA